MLGDRSVIPELMNSLKSTHPSERDFFTPLSRVESPEVYEALYQLATSVEDAKRSNAVEYLAALRGRKRISILSEVAVDPRNYVGNYYQNRTIGKRAVGALKMEQYPNESVIALLGIAQSDTSVARRAAADQAASFLDLVDRVDEDTIAQIRKLMESPHEEARLVAVDLLSRPGLLPSDLARLEKALDAPSFLVPSYLVRKRAAYALAKIRKENSFSLLNHTSWAVRSGAAEGLGSIVEEAMIPALEKYEKDKRGRVSRPVWIIKARVQSRLKGSRPVLQVQFRDLPTPK
jgi:hypothetical protein